MAEDKLKKTETVAKKTPRKVFKGPLLSMMLVAAFVILGYKLWENPQVWYQFRDALFDREDIYQPQIDTLQKQLSEMQGHLARVAQKAENPDFSEMDKRIDNIEQISVNTIKSKADVETVLGLIVRMDNAEGRLNDLAKVTDDSALILTAAMLVKDAGQRGGKFIYEADVLRELAAGHHKIDKDVARIEEIAAVGVPSIIELQQEFAQAYTAKYSEVTTEEVFEAKDWKDRIYHQLHKVVQIKKTDEVQDIVVPEVSEEEKMWGIISDYVSGGDINRAVSLLKKPINSNLLEDKTLAEWLKKAEIQKEFYESVSRISAHSLAVMKVKFLKSQK